MGIRRFLIARKPVQLPFYINGRSLMGWHCPNCKKYICTVRTGDHYCKECGQKLDWR